MLEFQHPKYQAYLEARLCQAGDFMDDFADLFDFRLDSFFVLKVYWEEPSLFNLVRNFAQLYGRRHK